MPSVEALQAIAKKFKYMLDGHEDRAMKAGVTAEDRLGDEFCDIVNDCILRPVKGQAVRPEPTMQSPPVDIPRYSFRHVNSIPGYVMRLSPQRYDKLGEQKNKADAAIFKDDVKLEKGGPNWVHQRFFAQFKTKVTHNDPFEDADGAEVQPIGQARSTVRGQLLAYANRVFAFQHRTALFSLFVIGSDFRFLRWDRSGVFVTERVNYVEKPSVLWELLLGFLILDDSSQGIDTTATLLDKDSEDCKFMRGIREYLTSELSIRINPSDDGSLLSSDVPRVPAPSSSGLASENMTELPQDVDPSVPPDSDALSDSTEGNPAIPQIKPKDDSFIFDYVLDYFLASVNGEWPCYRISIGEDTFLVGQPIYETTGLVGRGTRGYVAWHVQSKRFVFLKDVWRPAYEGVVQEGEIVKALNNAKVPHVPTVICHGDVDNGTTIVSDFNVRVDRRTNNQRKAASKADSPGTSDAVVETEDATTSKSRSRKSGKKRTASEREIDTVKDSSIVRHFTHYRMATREVCLPLNAFQTSKQLVRIIRDGIDAHAAATEKCKIVHRDVSSGNILILPSVVQLPGDHDLTVLWQGFLTDWELSKPVSESGKEKARQPVRTGTWRYMSRASLMDPLHVVATADEIESFFNVLLYHGARFLPHNVQQRIPKFITRYFLESDNVDGQRICGNEKNHVMVFGKIFVGAQELRFGTHEKPNRPLNALLKQLLSWFKARYDVMRYEETVTSPSDQSLPGTTSVGATPDEVCEPPPAKKVQLAQKPTSDAAESGDQDDMNWDEEDGDVATSKPPPETYAAAKTLKTHSAVQKLFWKVTTREPWSTGWPSDEEKVDHVGDNDIPHLVLDDIVADISSPLDTVDEAMSPACADSVETTGTAGTDGARASHRAFVFAPAAKRRIRKSKASGSSGHAKRGTGSDDLQMAWKKGIA